MSKTPVPISSLRSTFDSLVEIAKLEDDWDSYGGLPPTPLAIAAAADLIVSAADRVGDEVGEVVVPYAVMPFPSGGVQVIWRRSLSEIQVDVGPGGNFGYLLIQRAEDERRATEAQTASLDEVLALIKRILR